MPFCQTRRSGSFLQAAKPCFGLFHVFDNRTAMSPSGKKRDHTTPAATANA